MDGLQEYYGRHAEEFEGRKTALEAFYRARYRSAPERWVSSSGRAEIVGNHTDHNLGKVLVSAISCDILCAAGRRTDGIVEIASEDFYPIRFSVKDLKCREREKGKSVALARGVCRAVSDAGYSFGGFSAVTSSNLFRGAGVSSSAAFEVLVAELVNALYLDGALSPERKARMAQYAENVYFGKPCGLLDQSGVALGGLHKIDFSDASAPVFEKIPRPKGYALVMTNTGGSHAKLTAHYAEIRKEMGCVAKYFGKTYLREVPFGQFEEALPALRGRVSDRALLRAFHFYEENVRVDRAADALKRGDTRAFLAQVRKSGESSLGYLQNCCVAGESAQPVVLALKLSERLVKEGAYRMQGGGFAGTVLAFLKEGEEEKYAAEMARVFGRENVFFADIREKGACELNI